MKIYKTENEDRSSVDTILIEYQDTKYVFNSVVIHTFEMNWKFR